MYLVPAEADKSSFNITKESQWSSTYLYLVPAESMQPLNPAYIGACVQVFLESAVHYLLLSKLF